MENKENLNNIVEQNPDLVAENDQATMERVIEEASPEEKQSIATDIKNSGLVEKLSEDKNTATIDIPISVCQVQVGSNVYSSIDNYNPEIDTTVSYKQQLLEEVEKLRSSGSEIATPFGDKLNQIEGSVLENTPEENAKIVQKITEFFEENKELIQKELSIDSLYNLTPSQAAKLTSFLVISKLDYSFGQAIYPGHEGAYYEQLSDNEKLDYKKDYFVSAYIAQIYRYPGQEKYYGDVNDKGLIAIDSNTIKKQGEKLYNQVYNGLNKQNLAFLETSDDFGVIKQQAEQLVDTEFSKLGYVSENDKIYKLGKNGEKQETSSYILGMDSPEQEIYLANSKLFNKKSQADNLSVSELLECGEGVCRNYSAANEKLYEALKTMQEPWNNKLLNSALIFYSGNETGDKRNQEISDTEAGTNGHVWNALVTIDKDGRKHIAQIDTVFADTGLADNDISKVKQIDYTFDRVLNYSSDSLDKDEIKKLEPELLKYSQELFKFGDIQNAIQMCKKLLDVYNIDGNNEGIDDTIQSLSKNLGDNFEDNQNQRLTIINYLINNNLTPENIQRARTLLGKVNPMNIAGNILDIFLYVFENKPEKLMQQVDAFLANNPEFANADEKTRNEFLVKHGGSYGDTLIQQGLSGYELKQ